jgi:hypothetical protein
MSKSKHTPGPWKAQPREFPEGQWFLEGQWEVVSTCDIEWLIAAAAPHIDGDPDEANARLIAAAPELLEALMGLRLYVNPLLGGEEVDNARRAANAAIAKATGGNPMSKPDTSAEAQGRLVHEHDLVRATLGMQPYEHVYTAATLRALQAEQRASIAARNEAIRQLEAERDAAQDMLRNLAHALGEARAEVAALQARLRAASLDRLAANDAPLLDAEAAFAAGAEAMRRAAEDETDCGCAIRNTVIAIMMCDGERKARRLCSLDVCLALQAAAIRDLPLPKMEDNND